MKKVATGGAVSVALNVALSKKSRQLTALKWLILLMRPARLERATFWLVAGSSGKLGGGRLNYPAMFVSLSALGSVVLDVDGNQLDAKFIRADGTVGDNFTIIKGPAPNTN